MRQKTTHELAMELLKLPDVPVVVEGWCDMKGYETVASMTEYDPSGTAIISQEPIVHRPDYVITEENPGTGPSQEE